MGTESAPEVNVALLSIDVRNKRMAKKWTRKELARRAFVAEEAVRSIEKATAKNVLSKSIENICKTLRLSVKRYLVENDLQIKHFVLCFKSKGGKRKMKAVVKKNKLALALLHKRIENGWTQEEAAKHIGISKVSVCLIENGKANDGGIETLSKICKAFNLNPNNYIEFKEKE